METSAGCRLNGSGSGMITLEDLESFSDDQDLDSACHSHGSGSLEEDTEPMEDEQDRLLHYWQDIGRVHQVDVPTDMAVPIQQLTTNNHSSAAREKVPFTLITRKEKCGEILYEKRHYEKAKWACIPVQEEKYEQSICLGFMKLMRYICEQNSSGSYLGMTIPIVTVVRTEQSRSLLSREVIVAYHLPAQHQDHPPQPNDTDIVIQEWPASIIYTRSFSSVTNEGSILNEINLLVEALDMPQIHMEDSFIVAGYTNPAAPIRSNEIWVLHRP